MRSIEISRIDFTGNNFLEEICLGGAVQSFVDAMNMQAFLKSLDSAFGITIACQEITK